MMDKKYMVDARTIRLKVMNSIAFLEVNGIQMTTNSMDWVPYVNPQEHKQQLIQDGEGRN